MSNTETIAKAVRAMKTAGFDGLLAATPENFAYLAGFVVPSHHVLRWRHSVFILTADGRRFAFTVDMEESTLKRNLPDAPLRVWREFADNSMAVLADYLKQIGLESGKIGVELDYLPARDLQTLQQALPRATFTGSQDIFNRLRQIKTTSEIALLRRLSRISDKGISDAYTAVSKGSSEMDIAAALTRSVYEQGAQDFKLLIVATGERSQLPNVGPTQRVLNSGDICRVEIFSIIDGYHAGVCRTASVGPPLAKAKEIWAVLARATRELVDLIRPGLPTSQVYDAYLKMVSPLEMPSIDFVGHGIGLHLHEAPYLAKDDGSVLEEGMVFGIEPLIYRTGHGFGMQNKDMILVTAAGCELLSDHTNTERLIEIA